MKRGWISPSKSNSLGIMQWKHFRKTIGCRHRQEWITTAATRVALTVIRGLMRIHRLEWGKECRVAGFHRRANSFSLNHSFFFTKMCELVAVGYILLQSTEENSVVIEGKILRCAGCNSELGNLLKGLQKTCFYTYLKDIMRSTGFITVSLNLVATQSPSITLNIGQRFDVLNLCDVRFRTRELFYALCILSGCDSQTSLKLVIRSLDRTPALLVSFLVSHNLSFAVVAA